MKTEDKHTLIITILIIAVTFIIGFNFIYIPKMKNISNLRQEMKRNEDMEGVILEAKNLQEALDFYNRKLLPRDDMSGFLNEITIIARKAQIDLNSVTPQKPENYDDFKRLILKLGIKANYHQLGKFTSLLENSQLFIKIDECRLIVRQGEEYPQAGVVADIEMTLSAFVETR